MTEEVVRGELGWERQKARRNAFEVLGKIIRMSDDRITKMIHKVERLEREEAMKHSEGVTLTKTWCKYTRELMKSLFLEEQWRTETVGTEQEWNELIRDRIHNRE